jgi:hypothetical protein
MYRKSLELYLKAVIVGEGSNFLAWSPDAQEIFHMTSLRRLGTLVAQIVKRVGWDKRFSCDGIENLGQFRAFHYAL